MLPLLISSLLPDIGRQLSSPEGSAARLCSLHSPPNTLTHLSETSRHLWGHCCRAGHQALAVLSTRHSRKEGQRPCCPVLQKGGRVSPEVGAAPLTSDHSHSRSRGQSSSVSPLFGKGDMLAAPSSKILRAENIHSGPTLHTCQMQPDALSSASRKLAKQQLYLSVQHRAVPHSPRRRAPRTAASHWPSKVS